VHPDAARWRGQKAVDKLVSFWRLLGANVEAMAADHHDLVLAITGHHPHHRLPSSAPPTVRP
jgi:prephenate dehydrogenase